MAAPPPALREFLEHPARPKDTLSYHELQGFLFTVAAAPELIQPSEWLPIIFAERDPGYASLDEAQHVLDQLMALYNDINAAILEERAALPADCPVAPNTLDNFIPSAPLSQWSRGFNTGHEWLFELWNIDMPEDMGEEMEVILTVLSSFESRALSERLLEGGSWSDVPFETQAERLVSLLPEAVAGYAFIGRNVLAEAYAAEAVIEPRRVTRIGRNDPCPCGSGKKFKKCCGATVQ